MATQAQVVQILSQLKTQGEDMGAMQAKLEKLPEDKQHAFFDHLAVQMGMGSQETASPPQGAQAAFEAGNPNASFISDSGEQTYARPVSGTAAFASSALKSASSLPFVEDTAAKAITSVTGTTDQQYNQFQQAGQEQHPIASAVGELAGIGVGGKALGMVGEAGVAGAKAVAGGLRELAASSTGAVLQAGAKAVAWIHAPWASKLASMLEDGAALANPAVVRKNIQTSEQVLRSTGAQMAKTYSELSKEIPKDSLETALNLRNMVRGSIVNDAQAANVIRDERYYKALDNTLDEAFSPFKAQQKLTPNQIWGRAKGLAEEAKTFESSTLPSDVSRRGIMNDIQFKLREQLAAHADQHAMQTGNSALRDALAEQNKTYGVVSDGLGELYKQFRPIAKAEKLQAGADRVAQVLSYGKKLPSKYYTQLVSAVRRGGFPAAINLHSHLMNDNEGYRNAVGSADMQTMQQGQPNGPQNGPQ